MNMEKKAERTYGRNIAHLRKVHLKHNEGMKARFHANNETLKQRVRKVL